MSLQSKVLRHLEQCPLTWVVKVEVANFRGCPDALVCVKGQFLAIEIKEGKDVVSPIQDEQMLRITYKAMGKAWVVRDYVKFKDRLLKEFGVF